MIDTMYNTTFSATRETVSSSTDTGSSSVVSTGDCLIRPVTNRTQLFDENKMGKEYKVWCANTHDLKIGDIMTIDGVKYSIAGRMDLEDLEDDTDTHYELRVYTI